MPALRVRVPWGAAAGALVDCVVACSQRCASGALPVLRERAGDRVGIGVRASRVVIRSLRSLCVRERDSRPAVLYAAWRRRIYLHCRGRGSWLGACSGVLTGGLRKRGKEVEDLWQ